MGTPNRKPEEYSRNIIGIYLPGSLRSFISLLHSWGSVFGVPSEVPLFITYCRSPSGFSSRVRYCRCKFSRVSAHDLSSMNWMYTRIFLVDFCAVS